MTDASTSTIFVVSFLGALFAILASLLVVYSYVMMRLVPKLKHALRAFVEENGEQSAQANLDLIDVMQQLGVSLVEAVAASAPPQSGASPARINFTCEDHGRCIGCPKVLAQFEAIIRHQGEASFDDVERKLYAHLREQLSNDTLLDGESEIERQKRIAARVVETLVREGFATAHARGVVWAIGKDERATFAGWLSAARTDCAKLSAQNDQEKVA